MGRGQATSGSGAAQPRTPPRVVLNPVTSAAEELWRNALALINHLNVELGDQWTLIGGLMVQLHVNRYGDGSARPTDDIDVLGDSRKRPSATERIADLLKRLDFRLNDPAGLDMDTAYRFTRGEEIVDILGSDGTKAPPKTLGKYETIQVKGGTQALNRTDTVLVTLGGQETLVRCPTVLGGILLKARSVVSPTREHDREDLVRLLLCVQDPRAIAQDMKKSERKWLRDAGPRLDLDGDDLRSIFSEDQLATARVTYELLRQDD